MKKIYVTPNMREVTIKLNGSLLTPASSFSLTGTNASITNGEYETLSRNRFAIDQFDDVDDIDF